MIFYDLFLIILAIITLPRYLFQMAIHKKYRNSFGQRFGFGFPEIEKGRRRLIWIHAVSVGETKAVTALIKKLKQNENDPLNPLIILSTVTETGFAEGERSIPEGDFHVFLPFDFSWIIRPIIRKIKPDLVILSETDYWYNFLRSAKEQGANIVVVNGKLSDRSLKIYQKISYLAQRIFSLVDIFCLQCDEYKERFRQLGISEQKLVVTGNLKFDYACQQTIDTTELKLKLQIPQDDLVIVAGSTHDPEELLILQATEQLWKIIPNFTLILVPRHPERFDLVASLISQRGHPFLRFSELEKRQNDKELRDPQEISTKIILVDVMGQLLSLYQIASIAVVGGSFTPKVGGHNIMEPCHFGVPVIYGPYMFSQPDLYALMKDARAGLQISENQLTESLLCLLVDANERKVLGLAGLNLVKSQRGATERSLSVLKKIKVKKREEKG